MNTLTFELPETLWKVTKTYSTNGVRQNHIKIIEESSIYYYFKDVNLAHEFYYKFTYDYLEFVPVGMGDEGEVGYELNVIPKIEKINTIELIPEIVDL